MEHLDCPMAEWSDFKETRSQSTTGWIEGLRGLGGNWWSCSTFPEESDVNVRRRSSVSMSYSSQLKKLLIPVFSEKVHIFLSQSSISTFYQSSHCRPWKFLRRHRSDLLLFLLHSLMRWQSSSTMIIFYLFAVESPSSRHHRPSPNYFWFFL